jgi:type IV pilus assembly protein PilV
MNIMPAIQLEKKDAIHNRGFTIIEILIAMAVFAIGILAVGSMQISAVNNNLVARMRTEAVVKATELAENIMSRTYDNVQGADPTNDGIYTWEIAVSEDVPVTRTKTVQIDVCWIENQIAPLDCTSPMAKRKNVHLEFITADI